MESQLTTSLSAKITELFKDSLVFNPQMYETTLAILYDKLASYTGTFTNLILWLLVERCLRLNLCSMALEIEKYLK